MHTRDGGRLETAQLNRWIRPCLCSQYIYIFYLYNSQSGCGVQNKTQCAFAAANKTMTHFPTIYCVRNDDATLSTNTLRNSTFSLIYVAKSLTQSTLLHTTIDWRLPSVWCSVPIDHIRTTELPGLTRHLYIAWLKIYWVRMHIYIYIYIRWGRLQGVFVQNIKLNAYHKPRRVTNVISLSAPNHAMNVYFARAKGVACLRKK